MDMNQKQRFVELWQEYFPGAELPLVFYYTSDAGRAELAEPPSKWLCFIAQLAAVRRGESRCFNTDSICCSGGKRYLGFSQTLMPDFEYFLSCGISGKLEGERYKKSPEIVKAMLEKAPVFVAPAPYVVFKRWDKLEPDDEPEVAVFFAKPDVLAGLFTLAGFEESDLSSVIAPFAAGCGSIVLRPYLEKDKERPQAVLGMFDVSARPWVQKDVLSFALPMNKFARMVDNMEESFLITPSWARVRARI